MLLPPTQAGGCPESPRGAEQLYPVGEPDTLNELGQLVVAIEPAAAFRRRIEPISEKSLDIYKNHSLG
jgi:hypothetical protein